MSYGLEWTWFNYVTESYDEFFKGIYCDCSEDRIIFLKPVHTENQAVEFKLKELAS